MRRSKSRNAVSIMKLIINFFVAGLFCTVWSLYYNSFAFHTLKTLGVIIMTVLFLIVYNGMARLYKAFKVDSYQIGEIVFSQMLSFGIADLIMYTECCLISKRFVPLHPGVFTVFIQLLTVALWAFLAKQYFIHHDFSEDTLVIYGSQTAGSFIDKLEGRYGHKFRIVRSVCISDSDSAVRKAIDACPVIILYEVGEAARTELVKYCICSAKKLYITPRITDIILEGCQKRHLIDTPLLKYDYGYKSFGKRFAKRLMDIILSLTGLIIFSPIMLVTAAAIKVEDGGPVFFRQKRYTQDGKIFNILKFRSMTSNPGDEGKVIPCVHNDSRITRVGKVIRKYRIDEIPQIINVLTGQMSIVGPRPERIEQAELYTDKLPEFAFRYRVKGGLTGYAQIFGKYNTEPYDKLRLDLMYIENQSLMLDLKLILLTVKILFIPESTEAFTQTRADELLQYSREGKEEERWKKQVL